MLDLHYASAVTSALRSDPCGRDAADIWFEGKGYAPRETDNVFAPLNYKPPKSQVENPGA